MAILDWTDFDFQNHKKLMIEMHTENNGQRYDDALVTAQLANAIALYRIAESLGNIEESLNAIAEKNGNN